MSTTVAGPDFDAVASRLREAGCVFAEDEAAILIEDAVSDVDLDDKIVRRVAGEPLEYIVGWAEFRGLRICALSGVFVPRLRTTAVVSATLDGLPRSAVVLDLCCGSGAIGAAILDDRPDTTVHAADIDPKAVECARRTLSAMAPGRFSLYQGDLFDALPPGLQGKFDAITVNAPYVPTADLRLMPSEARDHEAAVALDGGVDGLELHRRIARGASRWLSSGGRILLETSARQASVSRDLLKAEGFSAQIFRDDDVDGTVVIGRTG